MSSKKSSEPQKNINEKQLFSHRFFCYRFRNLSSESQYKYFFYNESFNTQMALLNFSILICSVAIILEALILNNTLKVVDYGSPY